MKISTQVLSALTLTLALGGCSSPSAESLAQNDPWEKTNRDVFDFDVRLDHAVARPVAWAGFAVTLRTMWGRSQR